MRRHVQRDHRVRQGVLDHAQGRRPVRRVRRVGRGVDGHVRLRGRALRALALRVRRRVPRPPCRARRVRGVRGGRREEHGDRGAVLGRPRERVRHDHAHAPPGRLLLCSFSNNGRCSSSNNGGASNAYPPASDNTRAVCRSYCGSRTSGEPDVRGDGGAAPALSSRLHVREAERLPTGSRVRSGRDPGRGGDHGRAGGRGAPLQREQPPPPRLIRRG
mmetsp:Transcript_11926/g.27914  ORF Transcript_11926/g.27914 Transcript_11926/m.27914 type:complete len:217 (+) Transcript_11926:897-1547(+)